jgi:hypothetical protein
LKKKKRWISNFCPNFARGGGVWEVGILSQLIGSHIGKWLVS